MPWRAVALGALLVLAMLAISWQVQRSGTASGSAENADPHASGGASGAPKYGAAGPERYEVEGSTLWILDGGGRHDWSIHLHLPGQILNTPPVFADIDGDGVNEVLFNDWPLNNKEEPGRVVCFDASGDVLWEHRYYREMTVRGRYFEPFYSVERLEWLDTPTGPYVLTVARHGAWYPCQVALLDPASGEVVSEYWHPGWIYDIATFDIGRDGTIELLVGGANNPDYGPGRGGLAVLSIPFSEPNGEGNLFGAWNQRELRYLVFPALDAFEGEGFSVKGIEVQGPERVLLRVGNPPETFLYYYLDQDLLVTDLRPTTMFARIQRQLFRAGKVTYELDPGELERRARFAVVPTAPDGNSADVELLFEPR